MSAGLAHELNNPSAAAQRIAVHLGEVIQMIQSVAHRLHHTLEHKHWDRLTAVVGVKNLRLASTTRSSRVIRRMCSQPGCEMGGATPGKSLPCSSARDWK
jgi:hypothetical protein